MKPRTWWTSVPSFIKIVQAVKKLNSISRERLNFRRRPVLCTTLYRNLMQASNFGGTFDQLFLLNFFMNFSQKMPLYVFYTMVQKSQKWPKTPNQGGPALICISQQNTAFLCKNDSCMVLSGFTHHLGGKMQLNAKSRWPFLRPMKSCKADIDLFFLPLRGVSRLAPVLHVSIHLQPDRLPKSLPCQTPGIINVSLPLKTPCICSIQINTTLVVQGTARFESVFLNIDSFPWHICYYFSADKAQKLVDIMPWLNFNPDQLLATHAPNCLSMVS